MIPAERSIRNILPFKREPRNETQPGSMGTYSLTRSDKKMLRVYKDHVHREYQEKQRIFQENLERSMKEYWEWRDKDPKVQPLSLEDWRAYCAMRRKQKQEAAARGEVSEIFKPAPPVAEKLPPLDTTKPVTNEQRAQRNQPAVRDMHIQLEREVQKSQLDLIAKDIKKDMWKDTSKLRPLSVLKPTEQVYIGIKDDGTVVNRTRVGVSLSSPRSDREESDEDYIELALGIGYFTDRAVIAEEARQLVSDEDLQRGVKAYYVQRIYTERKNDKVIKKKVIVAIPFAYDKATRVFCEYLYDSAEALAPY